MKKPNASRRVILAFVVTLACASQGCEEKQLAEPPAAGKAAEMAAPSSGGAAAANHEGRPAEAAK